MGVGVFLNRQNLLKPDKSYVPVLPKLVKLTVADKKVCTKVTSKLKFLYRKNRFFSKDLKRLLCNTLIQPHFDYGCAAWYPNLNKKYKNKLQVLQN